MSRTAPWSTALAVMLTLALAPPAWSADPDPLDWPNWRGPEQNGISRETGLVDSWSPDGENLLWSRPELGSRSTPIVMNGKLYLLARLNPGSEHEGEKVVCANAETGETLWENKFNVFLSDVPDTRVAWSNVVGDPETGDVYALGVCGLLQCIDGATGKTKWSRSLSEEFGLLSTYGGRTNIPIIYEDQVIISSVVIGWGEKAKPQHSFLSFDKTNGQPVWYNGTTPLPDDTTYSTPVLTSIDGTPAMIFGSGDGAIHAFQPATGVPIWKYSVSMRGINTTPVIAGGIAIAGHSEENLDSNEMGALFALDITKKGDITKTGELWRNREMFVGKAAPLVVGDRIYAVEDKGNLLVVDLKTGEQIDRQKLGTQGRSSPLYADGKIYVCEANGRWFIYRITDTGLEQIHRLRLNGDVDASPIVSHGRLYVTTSEAMFCIGTKDQKPQADARPEPPAVASPDDDKQPAHLQIVPVESLLRSGPQGEIQKHFVRVYNARGQYIETLPADKVEFSIAGPGTVDAEGTYTTPTDTKPGAVILTAKHGDLTAQARLRIIPDFPWTYDFSDGQVPVQWVGARYRHIGLDFDLYKELESQSVLLSRLYVYFRSEFVNFAPTRTFDNTTPAQRWTEFLQFCGLIGAVKTVDDGKATLDPLFTVLKDKGLLAEWTWEDLGDQGPKLTIKRGPDEVKGNGVMCKITTIPKGTRSQSWMGRINASRYTIQADVYSANRDDKLSDAGIIGQRYRLDLMGASQELKLISWISHEEKYKTVPFAWKADTWYTLKLQTSLKEVDGKTIAVLNGKCWPRDAKEPDEWTITWEDEPGNDQGSPGVNGSAKDSEVFYDNIKVVAGK